MSWTSELKWEPEMDWNGINWNMIWSENQKWSKTVWIEIDINGIKINGMVWNGTK